MIQRQEKQALPLHNTPSAITGKRLLVFGGTQETGPLAAKLLDRGHAVLVSTATNAPLALPDRAERRFGRLDAAGISALALDQRIDAIVDAGHPFATELHRECLRSAKLAGIPYLRYARAPSTATQDVHPVSTHEEAASLACRLGHRVLLTTGSRNLECYVREAAQNGCLLFARVLDHPDSLTACTCAGLDPEKTFFQRGPFSLSDNLALLESTRANVLVTKDSGIQGGVDEKLLAAKQKGLPIVMVKRPEPQREEATIPVFSDMKALIAHLERSLS